MRTWRGRAEGSPKCTLNLVKPQRHELYLCGQTPTTWVTLKAEKKQYNCSPTARGITWRMEPPSYWEKFTLCHYYRGPSKCKPGRCINYSNYETENILMFYFKLTDVREVGREVVEEWVWKGLYNDMVAMFDCTGLICIVNTSHTGAFIIILTTNFLLWYGR